MDAEGTDNVGTFYISQFFYDGQGSLYLVCDVHLKKPGGEPFELCVFKLDIGTMLFYEGYVLAEGRQIYHVASINNYETHLITPDYVLSLEKHDFAIPGFPASALSKTEHFSTNKIG